ncbi:HIT-like domain-containing protein [Flagelloscypha sp. PMI_526]|nr:HIT-like domain-containing protein [Flagelloscypha sp. PMI_526]
MTSFVIKPHVGRTYSEPWESQTDCPFCLIIQNKKDAWVLYEDELVIAVLDILPIRRGHTLVIPKLHCPRLSDLPPDFAGPTGQIVSRIARAIRQAGLGPSGLNVVCNEEYAQAVPHVHYHVIPAPSLIFPAASSVRSEELSHAEMHRLELEAREELFDEDASVVSEQIRSKL